MQEPRSRAVDRLLRKLDELAQDRSEGALLVLEAVPECLTRLKGIAPARLVDDILAEASHRAYRHFPDATWARTSFNRYEYLVVGFKPELAAVSARLLRDLVADEDTAMLEWRAILTRIFPGSSRRTLECDAGYDLANLSTSAVVWVEPYPSDDWQEPQRYPTTEILWRKR